MHELKIYTCNLCLVLGFQPIFLSYILLGRLHELKIYTCNLCLVLGFQPKGSTSQIHQSVGFEHSCSQRYVVSNMLYSCRVGNCADSSIWFFEKLRMCQARNFDFKSSEQWRLMSSICSCLQKAKRKFKKLDEGLHELTLRALGHSLGSLFCCIGHPVRNGWVTEVILL